MHVLWLLPGNAVPMNTGRTFGLGHNYSTARCPHDPALRCALIISERLHLTHYSIFNLVPLPTLKWRHISFLIPIRYKTSQCQYAAFCLLPIGIPSMNTADSALLEAETTLFRLHSLAEPHEIAD